MYVGTRTTHSVNKVYYYFVNLSLNFQYYNYYNKCQYLG